jgi:HAD superfamily hydrolase (TIGR01509 family)
VDDAVTGSVPLERRPSGSGRPELHALVVDWGGVLTPPLDAAIGAWARRDGIEFDHFRDVMRSWVGAGPGNQVGANGKGEPVSSQSSQPVTVQPAGAGAVDVQPGSAGVVADVEQAPDPGPAEHSPVHRLERGELAVESFEDALAAELGVRGSHVDPRGLLTRMFADFDVLMDSMVGLIHRARRAGLRTALLSNSWTDDHYPAALFDGLFDAVVISGRVGMRKPEPRIYVRTADELDLPTSACVMVDDLPHNVTGAVATGMVGVLHTGYETTLAELEVLFGLRLGGSAGQPERAR